jgi:hypothetical protein
LPSSSMNCLGLMRHTVVNAVRLEWFSHLFIRTATSDNRPVRLHALPHPTGQEHDRHIINRLQRYHRQ